MNWIKSELDIYNKALANVETTNRQLARAYLSMQKEISDKLKQFYAQINPSWSKAYQAKRLTEIFKEINKRLSILTQITTDQLEKAYLKQYKEIFNKYDLSLTEMFKNKVPELAFEIPSEKTILASLNEKIGEYSFLKTMKNKQIILREALQEQVSISIGLGENPVKLAKRLSEMFGEGIARIATTARTELLKAYSIAQEAAIEEAEEQGIKFKFKWLGRNDGREREAHIALNNTYAKLNKQDNKYYFYGLGCKGVAPRLFTGINSATMNINCRCRKVAIPVI